MDIPTEQNDSETIPDDVEGGPFRPTESDFIPSPPKRPGPLEQSPDLRSFLLAIKIYAIIAFCSYFFWQGDFSHFYLSNADIFQRHEYWKLLTAILVHSDLGHLISNTPLLIIFGWFLLYHFGWRAFPIISLFVGVLANLATIYFYPPHTRLVGASGMIYGMVAIWLVWYIRYDLNRPVTLRIVRAVAFSLVVMFPTTFHETTSYLAHAAGFGIGLITAFLALPIIRPKNHSELKPRHSHQLPNRPLF